MKLSKVIIYLLVLAALGTYVYLVEIRQKEKELAATQKAEKIVDLKKDEIVAFDLKPAEKAGIELHKPANQWVMTSPVKTKADEGAVDTLLQSITTAKREKLLKDKDVDWKEYGLQPPEVTLTLQTKEKKVQVFFGAANPSKTSYYARVDDDPKLLLVADTVKNSLNKAPFDLRDKSVVGIAPEDVDKISISGSGKEIELTREGPETWAMAKPEQMKVKKSKVDESLIGLTSLRARNIIDEPKPTGDEYGLEKPEFSIVLAGKKLDQTLLVGKSAREKQEKAQSAPDRYARIKGRDTVYVIEGRVIDKILKTEPEELRDRALLAFNPSDIEKLDVELDGKHWTMAKGKDNKWHLDEPEKKDKIETWPVSGMLWALKDLEWKSVAKTVPENLGSLHLDKPQLVVSLLKKGETQPLILKAGWEHKPKDDRSVKSPQEVAPQAEEKTGKKEGATAAQEMKESEGLEAQAAPEKVNAVVQPHDEKDAVFTLDGGFVGRLREDLKRLIEKKE